MLIIIKNGLVHSHYNDDQAKTIFKIFELSEIEYRKTSEGIEFNQPLPALTGTELTESNADVRALAYSVLTDPLYMHDYRKGGNTAYKTEADAIAEQIKTRWPG